MVDLAVPSADPSFARHSRLRTLPPLEVLLAAPRGFCAGVRRAIDAVQDAIALHGAPVYVRRPIVHNLTVVRELEAQGAIFVEELEEIPPGSVVVLSAHGVAPAIANEAARWGLVVYDAVCPLVAKVHREVTRYYRQGRHVLLIGHDGHPEIEGTLGHLPNGSATLVQSAADVEDLPFQPRTPLAYAIQTTFSVNEASGIVARLKDRFADLAEPVASDICYATSNRQAAIHELAGRANAVVVVGEDFSSNARRLVEVAAQECRNVQLAAGAHEIDWAALPVSGGVVAITAAASTPESCVTGVIQALGLRYRVFVSEVATVEETVRFASVKVPGQISI